MSQTDNDGQMTGDDVDPHEELLFVGRRNRELARLTIVGPAEITTSGAPFVIVLSGMVHEEIGARPGHVVLHA